MNQETAFIFDIAKFAVHDGPGIRTVVFVKGCPLHCLWCHNPESQAFEPELLFKPDKCVLCGSCVAACPRQCHAIGQSGHQFARDRCIHCGICAEECPAEALKLAGREMSVSEVMAEVVKDQAFFRDSGGGVTISGGEPLAHQAFSFSLLKSAKEAGIHTAIETCGFAPWQTLESLLPVVNLWLWDVKAAPEHHRALTGVDSTLILGNLRRLDASGAPTELRCPFVPGMNDTEADIKHIADTANSLKHVKRISIEPYHPFGENKCVQLGREAKYRGNLVSPEAVEKVIADLQRLTTLPVNKA